MISRVLSAAVEFVEQPLAQPLVISSGAIHTLTEARATVAVECGGRRATGHGAIYLSDLWAWPDPRLSHAQRDAALRALCADLARRLPDGCGRRPAHPLELGLQLHEEVCRDAVPPVLARAMCASPFDAALHDATGRAQGVSAFALYGDAPEHAAIRRLLRPPRFDLPAWLLVGPHFDLERDLPGWVRDRGYFCFKIKLMAHDPVADARRTAALFQAARRCGAAQPRLTADSNEAHASPAAVREYLDCLRAEDAAAFAALEYLEQPTARDIEAEPHDWHDVARLKPVLLDEGLTDLRLLPVAAAQGWSGLALKTCKGHSFALAAAAWAHERGWLLSLQDLTNPGAALVHAALFAAHVPTLNGAELNSPQFTPAANADWAARWPQLFDPRDGFHRLPRNTVIGLSLATDHPLDVGQPATFSEKPVGRASPRGGA